MKDREIREWFGLGTAFLEKKNAVNNNFMKGTKNQPELCQHPKSYPNIGK